MSATMLGNHHARARGDRQRDSRPAAASDRGRVSPDPNYVVDSPQRRRPDLTKLKALANWRPRSASRKASTGHSDRRELRSSAGGVMPCRH
jgi:hypothetical protein